MLTRARGVRPKEGLEVSRCLQLKAYATFAAGLLIALGMLALVALPALAQTGFAPRYQRNYNPFAPVNRYRLDNPLNPADRYWLDNPFNPVNRFDPGNPANPVNRYNLNNPFNPIQRFNPDNPLNPINRYNPDVPFAPLP